MLPKWDAKKQKRDERGMKDTAALDSNDEGTRRQDRRGGTEESKRGER